MDAAGVHYVILYVSWVGESAPHIVHHSEEKPHIFEISTMKRDISKISSFYVIKDILITIFSKRCILYLCFMSSLMYVPQ